MSLVKKAYDDIKDTIEDKEIKGQYLFRLSKCLPLSFSEDRGGGSRTQKYEERDRSPMIVKSVESDYLKLSGLRSQMVSASIENMMLASQQESDGKSKIDMSIIDRIKKMRGQQVEEKTIDSIEKQRNEILKRLQSEMTPIKETLCHLES